MKICTTEPALALSILILIIIFSVSKCTRVEVREQPVGSRDLTKVMKLVARADLLSHGPQTSVSLCTSNS